MKPNELSQRLLQLDAADIAGISDDQRITWTVLDRDRRRVRFLTGLTIAVWLVAVLVVFKVLVGLALLMPRQAQLDRAIDQARVNAAERARLEREHRIHFEMATVSMGFGLATLALAAFLTVLLILASRGATLRQINASLKEIADQLREDRLARGPRSDPGPSSIPT